MGMPLVMQKGKREMNISRFAGCIVCAGMVLALCVGALPAQQRSSKDDSGLLTMIPKEAIFFVERRGHSAVREAFLASNLGKMTRDDAIQQFVHESRVRFGQWIFRQFFDMKDPQDYAGRQKELHGLLKPFWYERCALFLVLPKGPRGEPGRPKLGFLCATGKYAAECRQSLASLMKIGVAPPGQPCNRRTFTYQTGGLAWQGVAKSSREFTLPAEKDKRIERLKSSSTSLFMTAWMGKILLVALDLQVADALGRSLSLTGRRAGKADNASLRVVLEKTQLKDWAFRWFFDGAAVKSTLETMVKRRGDKPPPPMYTALMSGLGLGKTLGVGGTGGYTDGVFARMTYIHAPGTEGGALGVFKKGASYAKGHAMVPRDSAIYLAGHLDTRLAEQMIRKVVLAGEGRRRPPVRPGGRPPVVPLPPPAPPRPGAAPAAPGAAPADPAKRTAEILKLVRDLAEASDGNFAAYVSDLSGGFMAMMGGGLPVGFVLGVADHAKAEKAVADLVKLVGKGPARPAFPGPPGGLPAGPPKPPADVVYRKVTIRRMGRRAMMMVMMTKIAVLTDRIIIGLSDAAMKAGIDAALDGDGGFAPDSEGVKLTRLVGPGSALFVMDLAQLARAFWPMLMGAADVGELQGQWYFPLCSMPSAGKMARMLGPEIAVFQRDGSGLMLNSRGKIPFATKMIFAPLVFSLWRW